MEVHQVLEIRGHEGSHRFVGVQKAVMDFAADAIGVALGRDLDPIEVGADIVGAGSSSEGNDDGIELGEVAGEAELVLGGAVEGVLVLDLVSAAVGAGPSIDAALVFVSDVAHVSHLEGDGRDIGAGGHRDHEDN